MDKPDTDVKACEKCGSKAIRGDWRVFSLSTGRLYRVSCVLCGWDRYDRGGARPGAASPLFRTARVAA